MFSLMNPEFGELDLLIGFKLNILSFASDHRQTLS